MTSYKPIEMCFSDGQLKKLTKGLGVRIPNKNLSGKHVVHLTDRQLNKIAKCKLKKCGLVLKLSQSQLRHNRKTGGSIQEFLAKLKPLGKAALKLVAPIAINALAGLAKKKIQGADPIVEGISDVIKKRISGLGAKKKRTKKGKGWLSWLTKPLGDAVKDVVAPIGEIARENPELTQIAANAAMKAALGGKGVKKTGGFFGVGKLLGMGKKKRKRTTAGSFKPPGY